MKIELKPLEEQVVVVFGASSGIGRETALQFARRGSRVIAAARGEKGLDSLGSDVDETGGKIETVVADVAEFDQVKEVADRAIEKFGRLDTWVHCAGASLYARLEDTTSEEFRRILDVNLLGQFHGAKAALPHLRSGGGGALIHISSIEARRSLPYHGAYAASKHGISGFLESLRLELSHEGIPVSVTEVMPASINTPLFNKARTKLGFKPKGLPPYYDPSVVADVILRAAEHPTREVFAGGAARMFDASQKLSPRMMDEILSRVGFEASQTDEPKEPGAPDALFEPIDGYDRVRGDFGDGALESSVYSSVASRPWLRRAVKGAATSVVTSAAIFAVKRAWRNGKARSS